MTGEQGGMIWAPPEMGLHGLNNPLKSLAVTCIIWDGKERELREKGILKYGYEYLKDGCEEVAVLEHRALFLLKSENNGQNYYLREARRVIPDRAYFLATRHEHCIKEILARKYRNEEEKQKDTEREDIEQELGDLENYVVMITENYYWRWQRAKSDWWYLGDIVAKVERDFCERKRARPIFHEIRRADLGFDPDLRSNPESEINKLFAHPYIGDDENLKPHLMREGLKINLIERAKDGRFW